MTVCATPGWLALVFAFLLMGCASPHEDRFERMNRPIRAFNDNVDSIVIQPFARSYSTVLPQFVRQRVAHFYVNLSYPQVPLNQLLQGKPKLAAEDTLRFVVNSTLGIGGLFDLATDLGLSPHEEDFGQTFGVWGLPTGDYFVIPLWGGGTTRELIGDLLGGFFYAPRYLRDTRHRIGGIALDVINIRSQVPDVDSLIVGDRYSFLRDSWLQHREFLTRDGGAEDPFLDEF